MASIGVVRRLGKGRAHRRLFRFPQVTGDNRDVESPRPRALEAGLFPIVVALPSFFAPSKKSLRAVEKSRSARWGSCLNVRDVPLLLS